MNSQQEEVTLPEGRVRLTVLSGVKPFQNNVYVLEDPESKEALVIDASEAEPIIQATRGLGVKKVLLTHGHWDHHDGLAPLREALGSDLSVGIGAADTQMVPEGTSFTVTNGDLVSFGPHQLRALSTPGHTPGSTCFLIGDLLFTGDTLFPGGPGNTKKNSNPRGDFETIIRSLRQQLFTLPDATRVLPGHGAPTTIGTERPHLDEWVARGW